MPAEVKVDDDPRADSHVMRSSLQTYVRSRIHATILALEWHTIEVIPSYDRTDLIEASSTEETDKLHNWHRPTLRSIAPGVVQLCCFPGRDYVWHYAHLLATYAASSSLRTTIRYRLPIPVECGSPFEHSNLRDMGKVDVVIIGYVHELHRLQTGHWEGSGAVSSSQIFMWQEFRTANGLCVALLACLPTFWGDVSGHLVRALQCLNDIKCLLYIGKGGSLQPQHHPDKVIATGSCSYFDGRVVRWTNILEPDLAQSDKVVKGDHVNVRSPLVETDAWLEAWRDKACWVDCEVGYMAEACEQGSTAFAYLHIVSDNIAATYPFDLTNEHLGEVKVLREQLFDDIQKILIAFLSRICIEHLKSFERLEQSL